jgi:hypothetical protein
MVHERDYTFPAFYEIREAGLRMCGAVGVVSGKNKSSTDGATDFTVSSLASSRQEEYALKD